MLMRAIWEGPEGRGERASSVADAVSVRTSPAVMRRMPPYECGCLSLVGRFVIWGTRNASRSETSVLVGSDTGGVMGLRPITSLRSRWPVVAATGLSVLMVAGLASQLFDDGLGALFGAIPSNPLFYVALTLLYFSPPAFDWLIFRKLWRIPATGFVALCKKRIANEVVFGYSGEAYFYAWARERMKLVAAPFGTVKDVSILSALAGNAIALAMLGIALPFAAGLLPPEHLRTAIGSAALTVASTLPFVLFPRRVFSLGRTTLWWVFGMHAGRVIAGSALIGLAWHLALPDVPIAVWLLLAAARLLVSRLPLLPNKDLLFVSFTTLLIGREQAVSELVALTAAFALLAHAVVFAGASLQADQGR